MQAKGERPGPEDAAGATGKSKHLWAGTSNPKGSRLRKRVKEVSQGTPSPRGWESREQRGSSVDAERGGGYTHVYPTWLQPAHVGTALAVHPWSLRTGRGPQGCLPE